MSALYPGLSTIVEGIGEEPLLLLSFCSAGLLWGQDAAGIVETSARPAKSRDLRFILLWSE